jgi:hypothetical protein
MLGSDSIAVNAVTSVDTSGLFMSPAISGRGCTLWAVVEEALRLLLSTADPVQSPGTPMLAGVLGNVRVDVDDSRAIQEAIDAGLETVPLSSIGPEVCSGFSDEALRASHRRLPGGRGDADG